MTNQLKIEQRLTTLASLIAATALVACGGGSTPSAEAPSMAFGNSVSVDAGNSPNATTTSTDPANAFIEPTAFISSENDRAQASGLTAKRVGDSGTGAVTGTAAAEASKVARLPAGSPILVAVSPAPAPATAPAVAPAPTAVADGYLRTINVNANSTGAAADANGSLARPFKTINAAMVGFRPGDDIVVAAGVYREWVLVPTMVSTAAKSRIRAATARTVMVKGSTEVGGWTATGSNTYSVAWSGDEPEQAFRAGALLQQIGGSVFGGYPMIQAGELAGAHASEGGIWPTRIAGGVANLTNDSFTYDAATKRVVVKLSTPLAAGEIIEVSARRHVLQAEAAFNLTVEGLDFSHANTTFTYRQGALKMQGNANTLKNLTVRDMDGTCVQLIGEDNVLTDSIIERCGQVGITGSGKRLTIANNQVIYNNTRGFNKWWEAGGMKLIGWNGIHNSIVRNNVVAFNAGDGIWFDTKNTMNLVEGNITSYNEGFGIHYEASQSGTIRNNRSYGNTMRGIYLLESSSTLIQANAVFGNAMEGIGVVDGDRSAADSVLKPYDNQVIGNTIVWNDFDRNWIQLVLPGDEFRSTSDHNVFKAERIAPRMSMKFMSPTNYPYERLNLWQTVKRLDLASDTQTVPMPANIKAALAAKQLMTTSELPTALVTPGNW